MVVRVLLCDDTPELRALMRWALEQRADVRVVGEAGDGVQAAAQAASLQPEVVVLDLDMPGPGPGALIEAVRAAAPAAALVTFSGHDPAVVAGPAASSIDLHLPKTTDLANAASAVHELGLLRRR
jgi:DNA-binding NarL/FixJ family response regulator